MQKRFGISMTPGPIFFGYVRHLAVNPSVAKTRFICTCPWKVKWVTAALNSNHSSGATFVHFGKFSKQGQTAVWEDLLYIFSLQDFPPQSVRTSCSARSWALWFFKTYFQPVCWSLFLSFAPLLTRMWNTGSKSWAATKLKSIKERIFEPSGYFDSSVLDLGVWHSKCAVSSQL